MQQLIRLVFIAGMVAATIYGGSDAKLIYLLGVFLVITLFRRQLVLGLTHLASRLGLMRETIERMPDTIQLTRAPASADSARPIVTVLGGASFVDAGAWTISSMPKVQVTLMVQAADGMLAAIESFPLGAHVNLHTLYPDGRVVSFSNTELPAPKVQRPNVQRTRVPKCSPGALVLQARRDRPPEPFRPISVEDAPRLYEQLYAEEIQFRKQPA